MEDFHLDRLQPEVFARKGAKAGWLRRSAQAAVQIVDPAVERADDGPFAMARRPIHHPRAAMAAQIVKGPHNPVLTAHDHSAFAQKVKGQPVTRRGQVTFMPHHLPMGQKDLFTL